MKYTKEGLPVVDRSKVYILGKDLAEKGDECIDEWLAEIKQEQPDLGFYIEVMSRTVTDKVAQGEDIEKQVKRAMVTMYKQIKAQAQHNKLEDSLGDE